MERCTKFRASQAARVAKNPPAHAGDEDDTGQSLGQEDPLEKEMAPHSSSLAWKLPRAEEPGRLHKELDMTK